MTFHIVNPRELGAPRGWNNGMLASSGCRILFVAGQIGVEEREAEQAESPGADEPVDAAERSGEPADAADAHLGASPVVPAGRQERLAAQFGVALARVVAVVQAAGGAVADVGRLTVYVTDMDAYRGSLREVGAAYRAVFGRHFPAMALVAVTELVDPRAVVEVEATAAIPAARPLDDLSAGAAPTVTAASGSALPPGAVPKEQP